MKDLDLEFKNVDKDKEASVRQKIESILLGLETPTSKKLLVVKTPDKEHNRYMIHPKSGVIVYVYDLDADIKLVQSGYLNAVVLVGEDEFYFYPVTRNF